MLLSLFYNLKKKFFIAVFYNTILVECVPKMFIDDKGLYTTQLFELLKVRNTEELKWTNI